MAITIQNSAAAALYGAGNAAVSSAAIQAFINAPGRTAAEIQSAAVANKVNVTQISQAMAGTAGFSTQNIHSYLAEQGITPPEADQSSALLDPAAASAILYGAGNDQLTDAEIRDYISQPGRTPQEVFDAALANHVSAAQMARAMDGDPDYTLANINQALASIGISDPQAPAEPADPRTKILFGAGNPDVSAEQIQAVVSQPGVSSEQVLAAMLEHGVSAQQLAAALPDRPGYSLDNITNYIASQGIAIAYDPSRYLHLDSGTLYGPGNAAISDDQIRAFVNATGGDENLVIDAALANGVSIDQIARAMPGNLVFSLDNLNDVVGFKQDVSTLNVLGIEQQKMLQAIADSPTLEGSQAVMDSLRASLAELDLKLTAARAKVDARIAQGQVLDAAATQAEAEAAAVKAQFDPLLLASLHAQAKIDEKQAVVNAAQADVDRAQAALDAANKAIAGAAGIKKKSRRHRVRGEAQAAAKVASEELAAAQQRLAAAQPGLAQAQAEGAPAMQAAQNMQPQWLAAHQKAVDARAQSALQLGAAERAVALEEAIKTVMTFDEANLVNVGKVKAGQVQALIQTGALSGTEMANAVRDIEFDAQEVTDLIHKVEAAATADRAQASALSQGAVSLQTQAYGSQLIAQSLMGEAAGLFQANTGAADALAKAQSEFDAASVRLSAAKLAFSQADFAVDWQQAKKDPAKSAKGLAVMQPRFDAAQTELDNARMGFDDAQLKLNSIKHLATPLAAATVDAEFAAIGAAHSADVAGQQAGAASSWALLAQRRYESTDTLLSAIQDGVAQGTRGLGQVLGTVADHTTDAGASQVLHVQANHDLAWADEYAGLTSDARASAEHTQAVQDEQNALVVQAGGVQILSAYLKDRVATNTQAYEKAKAEVGVWQEDFQKAADQTNADGTIANEARNAMMTAETNADLAYVQAHPRPLVHPPVTAQSMLLPAIKKLMTEKGTGNPNEMDGVALDPIQIAMGAGLNLNEVKALATKMAQEETERVQVEEANMTPADLVQRWLKDEMAGRKTTRKKLHVLDDMAQFKENDPALKAARQTALDTATALHHSSQAAIDAGETLQAGVIVAGLRGQALLGVQTQLQQATASAAEISAQVGQNALVLADAGQAELKANQQLQKGLAGLIDSSAADAASLNAQAGATGDAGVAQVLRDQAQNLERAPAIFAPQIEHAQATVALAGQIIANAQASATTWVQVAGAMKTWAAEEVTKLEQVKAVVDEGGKTLDELSTKSGATLDGMYNLNIISDAALKEHADRTEQVQELHEDRLAYDSAYKRKKSADLVSNLTLGVAAAALFIITVGEAAPFIMAQFAGTELAATVVVAGGEFGGAAVAAPAMTLVEGAEVVGSLASRFVPAAPSMTLATGANATGWVSRLVPLVRPGSLAWLGTGTAWAGGSAAGSVVSQGFNLAVGRADKFNWKAVRDLTLTGLVTGGVWGLGTQLEFSFAKNFVEAQRSVNSGVLYQSQIYHAVPYLPNGATIAQTGRRLAGSLLAQTGLMAVGVNDKGVSLRTAMVSALTLNMSAQVSGWTGSANLVNSYFGQIVNQVAAFSVAQIANVVTGDAKFDWVAMLQGGVARGFAFRSLGHLADLKVAIRQAPLFISSKPSPSTVGKLAGK